MVDFLIVEYLSFVTSSIERFIIAEYVIIRMKSVLIGLTIILLLFTACSFEPDLPISKIEAGNVLDVNIQTPHPIPSSNEGTKLVWSYVLFDSKAKSIRLHYNKLDITGFVTNLTHIKTYPPCKFNDTDKFNDTESDFNSTSQENLGINSELCGDVEVYYSPQEIVDNNYLEGDYILIKDNKNNEIIGILSKYGELIEQGSGFSDVDGWGHIYETNNLTIELYVDEFDDNSYGLYIDKYSQLVI